MQRMSQEECRWTEEHRGNEGRCCGYSPEEKFATAETAAAAESWLRPSPARRGGGGGRLRCRRGGGVKVRIKVRG